MSQLLEVQGPAIVVQLRESYGDSPLEMVQLMDELDRLIRDYVPLNVVTDVELVGAGEWADLVAPVGARD
jgi:hypothetical protein